MPLRVEALSREPPLPASRAARPRQSCARRRDARRSALQWSARRSGSVWTMAASSMRGRLLVVNLGRHGIDGVRLHGHGQFAQVAVVEDAAARSHLKGALLLLLCAPYIFRWRTICSQNRRAAMAMTHNRKKRQTSQKRARLRGTTRELDCDCGCELWTLTIAPVVAPAASF